MKRQLKLIFGLSFCAIMFSATATQAVPITIGTAAPTNTAPSLDGWQAIGAFQFQHAYTNTSGFTEVFTATESTAGLRFKPGGVFTPFLVKYNNGAPNDPNSYEILSIGTSRVAGIDWAEADGVYTFPFSDTPVPFTVEDGETIIPAGMDSYADGTPGGGSTIPFGGGSQSMLFGGGGTIDNLGPLVVGQPPSGSGTSHGPGDRDYQFNITFDQGFVIPEPTTATLALLCAAGLTVIGLGRPRNRVR